MIILLLYQNTLNFRKHYIFILNMLIILTLQYNAKKTIRIFTLS